jgi:hypothetical protein
LRLGPSGSYHHRDVCDAQFARRQYPPVARDNGAVFSYQNVGAATLSEIVSALNARGARPARGGKWHRSSVRNLLARIK